MSVCIVCTTAAFRGLSMSDKDVLARVARDFIQGMMLGRQESQDSLKNFQPPRRGTCIVERCARTIEAACESCQEPSCQRCAIAAELRAAEKRINADRDAELMALADDTDLEALVDKMAESLCVDHVAFGPALAGQWYGRRGFLVSSTVVDAPHGS